jgi:CheY-like chemotaxis protein
MKRLDILLAEDNLGDVFLVQEALHAHHIEHFLRVIRDGEEAMHYLGRMGSASDAPCPDVFLVDLNLPGVDGYEILEQFRSHPRCRSVPVVIITSSDAPLDRAKARQLGVNAYFRKPSDLTEFLKLGAIVVEIMANVPTEE